MRCPGWWVVLLWTGLGTGAGGAADYWVAPRGDDSGAGTEAAPFRSAARGIAAAVQAGDRVLLRGGEYRPRGTLNLVNPGQPGRAIVLQAADGERAVIDGRDTPDGANLIAVLAGHIRVEGLVVRNAKASGVVAWGVGKRVHDVEVVGCEISRCGRSGFYAGSPDLEDPVRRVLAARNSITETSLDNRDRSGRHGGWAFALGAGLAEDVVLRDNRVSRGYGEGIGLYLSKRGLIEGNRVWDHFAVNVYLDNATAVRVARNVVYSTGDTGFFRFGKPSNGIQVANEDYGGLANPSAHHVIEDNLLVGNGAAFYYGSYQRGGGLRDTVVRHNTAYGSAGAMLAIDGDAGHARSRVTGNLFVQTGGRAMAYVPEPSGGIEFERNAWSGGAVPNRVRGRGDIGGDVRFANPGGLEFEDYRLPDCSRAAGFGVRAETAGPVDDQK